MAGKRKPGGQQTPCPLTPDELRDAIAVDGVKALAARFGVSHYLVPLWLRRAGIANPRPPGITVRSRTTAASKEFGRYEGGPTVEWESRAERRLDLMRVLAPHLLSWEEG